MIKKVWILALTFLLPLIANSAVTIVDEIPNEGVSGNGVKPIIRPLVALANNDSFSSKEESIIENTPDHWIVDPKKDKTYKEVFTRWAETAKWTLLWQLPRGYEPKNKSNFVGDFTTIFTKACLGLGKSIGPLDVRFYRGNRVITVSELRFSDAPSGKKTSKKKGELVSVPFETKITFLDDAYVGVETDIPVIASSPKVASTPRISPVVKVGATTAAENILPPFAAAVIPASANNLKWTVQPGSYLRDILQEWSARAGWGFVWGLPSQDDFRLGAHDVYTDDFKGAVTKLVDSLPATVKIRVRLVADNNPPLLYVTGEEMK